MSEKPLDAVRFLEGDRALVDVGAGLSGPPATGLGGAGSMRAALEAGIEEIGRRLREGPRVTVLTGAGVSAASGVPVFRGPGGLWRGFRPERLATPEAFDRDPALVWTWYDWRRATVARCQPNRAHEVLAAWSRRWEGFTLITQNVDGLHERAGTRRVLRFHGSLWEVSCRDRCARSPATWRDDRVPIEPIPPPCPHCGGRLRPAVVWFGEPIDPEVLRASAEAVRCDVFLTIGTSAVVHPAAGLVAAARGQGAWTAEINPQATPASPGVDLAVAGRAEDVLDRVEARLGGSAEGGD